MSMERARELATRAASAADESAWFERLYAEAENGRAVIPWAHGAANPYLAEWTEDPASPGRRAGADKKALVIGCGFGYDAEYLSELGYDVTAFDIAPTAIRQAVRENPGTRVSYVTADLLSLPSGWDGAFDLVAEVYTVQPLYGSARGKALAALHRPVAPDGTLLVIARATNDDAPERDPGMMPWPLTRQELERAGGPLEPVSIDQFLNDDDPPGLRWRAEFRHSRDPLR